MMAFMQGSTIEPVFFIRKLKLIAKLLSNSDKAIMFLLKPADTSENASEGPLPIAACRGIKFSGAFKAIFWILMSISIVLLIGRLS